MVFVAATVVVVSLFRFVLVYTAVTSVVFKKVAGVPVELNEVDAVVNSVRFKPRFAGVVKFTVLFSASTALKQSTRSKKTIGGKIVSIALKSCFGKHNMDA